MAGVHYRDFSIVKRLHVRAVEGIGRVGVKVLLRMMYARLLLAAQLGALSRPPNFITLDIGQWARSRGVSRKS